jgi:hypothetical protein
MVPQSYVEWFLPALTNQSHLIHHSDFSDTRLHKLVLNFRVGALLLPSKETLSGAYFELRTSD